VCPPTSIAALWRRGATGSSLAERRGGERDAFRASRSPAESGAASRVAYEAAALLVAQLQAQRADAEDPVEPRLDETFFGPARTRCGTDAWNAAAREGSALSFEDAIAYALEEPRA
jgi:hypothetical protein